MAGAKGNKSGDVKESTDSSTTIEEDEKGRFLSWFWIGVRPMGDVDEKLGTSLGNFQPVFESIFTSHAYSTPTIFIHSFHLLQSFEMFQNIQSSCTEMEFRHYLFEQWW